MELKSQKYINIIIRGSDSVKLIVGLGNPGKDYDKTRHNMGFMSLDYYVNKNNLPSFKERFNGLYIDCVINGEKTILLKPLSYMNLSGIVVKKFVDYFKIDTEDILIICDDLDMPVGRLKLKYQGSSGGHNGLKNIEENIGTKVYKRLKLGIGNDKDIITKDYVLSKFNNRQLKVIDEQLELVSKIIDDYLELSFDKLMNKYNGTKIGEENV